MIPIENDMEAIKECNGITPISRKSIQFCKCSMIEGEVVLDKEYCHECAESYENQITHYDTGVAFTCDGCSSDIEPDYPEEQ